MERNFTLRAASPHNLSRSSVAFVFDPPGNSVEIASKQRYNSVKSASKQCKSSVKIALKSRENLVLLVRLLPSPLAEGRMGNLVAYSVEIALKSDRRSLNWGCIGVTWC